MSRFVSNFLQQVMVALLALALAGVGFGHRMGVADPVDLTAYAMPDGTLPQLCLDGSADTGMKQSAPCPACLIAAAMEIPVAVTLPPQQLGFTQAVWPGLTAQRRLAHTPRAPPARGPPHAFLI